MADRILLSVAQLSHRLLSGLIVGDEVLDLSDEAVGLPPTMAGVLALGSEGMQRVRAAST